MTSHPNGGRGSPDLWQIVTRGRGESVVLWCHTSRFNMHATRSHTRNERCGGQCFYYIYNSFLLQLLWRSVTIWMNLMEFVKVLFLKVLQLCKPICASRTQRCCLQRCERVRTTVRDRKTVRLMKSLWRKIFRQAVQNLKNSCVQAALFSLRHVSKGAFLQIAFLRISVLSFWYQFNF